MKNKYDDLHDLAEDFGYQEIDAVIDAENDLCAHLWQHTKTPEKYGVTGSDGTFIMGCSLARASNYFDELADTHLTHFDVSVEEIERKLRLLTKKFLTTFAEVLAKQIGKL